MSKSIFKCEKNSPQKAFSKLKFVLGDVRDYESVKSACMGVDHIIHTAAMKHVHLSEMNPDECIKTNVNGAQI